MNEVHQSTRNRDAQHSGSDESIGYTQPMNSPEQSGAGPRHVDDVVRIQSHERPFSIYDANAPDWRIWFGTTITVLWLILLSIYVSGTVGWANIPHAPIETVGNFLEGAFAPLAFLWLVIGYFLQKKELAQNTDAIKMQYIEIQKSAAQAEIQSEAIKASELHARKESFLRIADSVRIQLGAIVGFLYLSSQATDSAEGHVSQDRIATLWSEMNQRDPEVFSRAMLQLQFRSSERYCYKLFYGTPIRTRHCENFIFNFERLIKVAEESDAEGMIRDSLLGSAHGFIYDRMIRYRDEPPEGMRYRVYDFNPDTND